MCLEASLFHTTHSSKALAGWKLSLSPALIAQLLVNGEGWEATVSFYEDYMVQKDED